MYGARALVLFTVFLIGTLPLTAPASAADSGKLLLGTWKMVTPAKDAAGTNCPSIPEMMTFFGNDTVMMSYMAGRYLPFKIDLTSDEQQAMEERDATLKGRKLLLVKPTPQTEWTKTPIVYSYSVTPDELTLTVTGWTPATFHRVQ
jgi:hypothetical protein